MAKAALRALVYVAAGSLVACARSGGPAPAASSSVSPVQEAPQKLAVAPSAAGSTPAAVADRVRETVAELGAEDSAAPESTKPAETATYLGSFQAADVRAAVQDRLGPADSATRWRIAEWKARPGSVVALSFHAVPFGGNVGELRPAVAVLEKHADKLVPIADTKLALGRVHCENGSGEKPSDEDAPVFDLDLARYAIAPGSTAVGVRFTCHNTFPAGEANSTQLALLELRDGRLREILREPIGYSNHDRPSWTDFDASGLVIMQTTAHDGHFDLVIQMTNTTTHYDSGSAPEGSSRKVEKRRYIWSSGRYISEHHG